MNPAPILNAADPSAIKRAADIIRQGGIVAFPTETVYGLAADVENPLAVARVFEAKGRPSIDPVIVHVADRDQAGRYGDCSRPFTELLMDRFWPGPLTLVVPRKETVPPIVTAGLDTVAMRMPAHPAALALIRSAGRACAAPSANPFGYVSPTEASHVANQLGDRIDLILDGGPCTIGVESTVLSLSGPRPRLLRPGGIALEDLENLLGPVERVTLSTATPLAPGQLTKHYATRTPLVVTAGGTGSPGGRVGLLAFAAVGDLRGFAAAEVLSERGDLREAAARLFAALRRLDGLGLDLIVARPLPEIGLGTAIMDRLRRCAAGSGAGPAPE